MNIYTKSQVLKFETSIPSVEYIRKARRYGPPETTAHTSHGDRPFSPDRTSGNPNGEKKWRSLTNPVLMIDGVHNIQPTVLPPEFGLSV